MLARQVEVGMFEALKALEKYEVKPFEDGYEGSPSHDFIGRMAGDWDWPGDVLTASRTVALWNLEGVAAILLEASGVTYANQTGGHACLQSCAEGILIPFNDDTPLEDPDNALCRRLSRLLESAQFLTPTLADQIDVALATDSHTKCATVDRDRLRDSHEAWVYVDLRLEADGLLQGPGPLGLVSVPSA